jgi:putative resolvase
MSTPPPRYVKPGEAERVYGVDRRTLKRWAESGHLRSIQPGGVGQRLYDVSTAAAPVAPAALAAPVTTTNVVAPLPEQTPSRGDVVYARVSTRKQTDDLARQVERLRGQHPDATVFTDVASGINFKRKGLLSLLQLAAQGRVRHVHVAHKDRLCRFAYDLVEHVLKQHGATIVVDAHGADTPSAEQDLADDLISIVTVFGARLYGRRSAAGRKRKRDEREQQQQPSSTTTQAPEEDAGDGSSSGSGDEREGGGDGGEHLLLCA